MKIVITDYKDELKRDTDYEIDRLKDALGDVSVEVYPYEEDNEKLVEHIKDADAIITAFLDIDEDILNKCSKLKAISVNAAGYGNIDISAAKKKNIAVMPVREYCTNEVAEHTMALMLSSVRKLNQYRDRIEDGIYSYQSVTKIKRMAGQTLAIFGLGRIGRAVLKRAQAFDMNVIAVDPYVDSETASQLSVKMVTKEYALKSADIITNHMNQTTDNKSYFSTEEFDAMERKPIFINVGRGSCVDEDALREALISGKVTGAALDVLSRESYDGDIPFREFENVIITPHAAFYSDTSMRDLQNISCDQIISYMNNRYDECNIVNR